MSFRIENDVNSDTVQTNNLIEFSSASFSDLKVDDLTVSGTSVLGTASATTFSAGATTVGALTADATTVDTLQFTGIQTPFKIQRGTAGISNGAAAGDASQVTINFPTAFVSAPVVSATIALSVPDSPNGGQALSTTITAITNTNFVAIAYSIGAGVAGNTLTVNWIAVGN